MAIFHVDINVISRGDGSSAVGVAAYRFGEKLEETKEVMELRKQMLPKLEKQIPNALKKLAKVQKEMEDLDPESKEWKALYKKKKKHQRKIDAYEIQKKSNGKYNYSKRKGILHTEIITPDNAPSWMQDRQKLWNAAEVAEGDRINGRVAREVLIALPHELTENQQRELTKGFGRWISNRYNVVVDFSVYKPHLKHTDKRNAYAYIMFTTREITVSGLGEKTKILDTNKTIAGEEIKTIRIKWEELANKALADSGSTERIDHRSHKEKEDGLIPNIHMGQAATAMERRGINTFKSNRRS